MFPKPPQGSIITVTTKHRDYYYLSTRDFSYYTYKNVTVLNYNDPILGPNDIKITANNTDGFRIINRKNIHELLVGDVKQRKQGIPGDHTTVLEVKGSKGDIYNVTITNGTVMSCSCPHFTFRRQKCKHMTMIEQKAKTYRDARKK